MNNEPIISVGIIVAFIDAAIAVAVAFGVHITNTQSTAIDALIVASFPIITIVGAFIARSQVMPVAKAKSLLAAKSKK